MLPFCGYHMGDYFGHWLEMADVVAADALPKIFYVNWFRKDADGRFMWPGYGDNSRVLAWIVDRLEGRATGVETPIGVLPAPGELDVSGLDLPDGALEELLRVDLDTWRAEAALLPDHFKTFGEKLPQALWDQYEDLVRRLG
jgi:phosphoenolpyruvate carboxykinase (GTP)